MRASDRRGRIASDDDHAYEWRGAFESREVEALHSEAFDHDVVEEFGWQKQTRDYSLGWVCARVAAVDFEDHLRSFSFDACGFAETNAGLIQLKDGTLNNDH